MEIDDYYLSFYTNDHEYMIRETIRNFIEKYRFIRVSRSIAVNLSHVLERLDDQIILNNLKRFNVSKLYINDNC